jgi:hypothetical protein
VKVLLLVITMALTGCSLFTNVPIRQSSSEPAMLGVKLSMNYQEIRRALKAEGYIISTRAFDNVFGKITLAATDHGAIFPSIELKLCFSGNVPLSLLLLGDNGPKIMAEATRNLGLNEFSRVDNFSWPALTAARAIAEQYYPQRLLLYQDIMSSVFCLQEAGPCAVYMENRAAAEACLPTTTSNSSQETP